MWRPFWFAMAAILNPKWPPKYKNHPIWAIFGFQVDFDVWELISMVWDPYYGFFYLAAILYLGCHGNCRHFEFFQTQKSATYYGGYSYKVDHNMAPKPWMDETFQKFCLICVHIILRLRNFRMAAVATKNVKNLKCSELNET
jgi:hypothetical protein